MTGMLLERAHRTGNNGRNSANVNQQDANEIKIYYL